MMAYGGPLVCGAPLEDGLAAWRTSFGRKKSFFVLRRVAEHTRAVFGRSVEENKMARRRAFCSRRSYEKFFRHFWPRLWTDFGGWTAKRTLTGPSTTLPKGHRVSRHLPMQLLFWRQNRRPIHFAWSPNKCLASSRRTSSLVGWCGGWLAGRSASIYRVIEPR